MTPPPKSHRFAVRAGLLAVLALVACARERDPGPAWRSLAEGFEPPLPGTAVGTWEAPGGGGYGLAPEDEGWGFWVELDLPAQEWRPEPGRPGVWSIDRPLTGIAPDGATGEVRLTGGETSFEPVPPPQATERMESGIPCFFLMARRLVACLPGAETLPSGMEYAARCDPGFVRDGTWRARSRLLTGDGLSLLAGQAVDLTVAVPARGRLFFATVALGLEPDATLRFRVLLDGDLLFEHEQGHAPGEPESHVLELAPQGRAGARLRFEVSGSPGLGTFLTPRIGPPGTPGYAERRRPDLLLFQADTFRADNLELYGGAPGHAPELDRFAEQCVRFLGARSPASWTLPAMSSLFTGLHPPQHTVQVEALSLSEELVTLAEQLGAHGYRTGAITDSGFVSAEYGLDQGFQVFQERSAREWDLRYTLDWALDFLASSDGRPTFLFVHTYRTHYPYRQGVEEDLSAWIAALKRAGVDDWKTGRPPEELLPYAEDFRGLYLDGVAVLDQLFAGFWRELEGNGWADRGYLVFTSDHGEGLGEHVEFGHGGQLWDVKIRIPLLIHGPGLPPRDEPRSASLVDLPATLAALAGLPPGPGWTGRPLLELAVDRPLFAFNAGVGGEHLAIVTGQRKILTSPDPEVLARGEYDAAFDLAADPGEEVGLEERGAEWASQACRSFARLVEELGQPRVATRAARLSGPKQGELRAIGYGD